MYIQNIATGAARENYSQTGRAFNMTVGTSDFHRSLLNATNRQSQANNYQAPAEDLDPSNTGKDQEFFSGISESLKGLSISGNSIYASMLSGSIIDGEMWNDKLLGERIENNIGLEEINTSKKVNWNADGSNKLSPEKLEALKSKYDNNNLDGQGYYNLIADLTNMNAISTENIGKMVANIESTSKSDIFSMLQAG